MGRGTPLQLKTFIAGRNRLEFTSTAALAEAFKAIGTLEEISMPQNGIRAEGIIKLAEAVRMNPSLKKLALGDNTFGESGAIAMADALENLSELELVDFSDCLCRNRGSLLIAQKLVVSSSPLQVRSGKSMYQINKSALFSLYSQVRFILIKELNLSGNEITTEAAKQIVHIVRAVPGLESLKIGVNCFGSEFDTFSDFAQPFGFVDAGTERYLPYINTRPHYISSSWQNILVTIKAA